jgi:hypothetical protein
MHPAFEESRDETDRAQFRGLRRLDAEPPDGEPSVGVVHGRAEQHGNQTHRHQAEAAPDEDRLAVVPVVHPHDDGQQCHAERRRQHVLREKEVGLLVAIEGHDR